MKTPLSEKDSKLIRETLANIFPSETPYSAGKTGQPEKVVTVVKSINRLQLCQLEDLSDLYDINLKRSGDGISITYSNLE